jgi:hypothetical protein
MKIIFVVGTGRSGTHFTCHCLREFGRVDDFQNGQERGTTLFAIAHAAMMHESFPRAVLAHYRMRRLQAFLRRRILVDQHHPNLFFIDDLLRLFPGSVFVYPSRPAVQVVASMIAHGGVSGWYDQIKAGALTVPFPNRFFGLENVGQLTTEPAHRICWYRIRAHRAAALAARARHGADRVRFLDYESLVRDRDAALAKIFSADELGRLGRHEITVPSTASSLQKYRDALSAEQIAEIEALEAAEEAAAG